MVPKAQGEVYLGCFLCEIVFAHSKGSLPLVFSTIPQILCNNLLQILIHFKGMGGSHQHDQNIVHRMHGKYTTFMCTEFEVSPEIRVPEDKDDAVFSQDPESYEEPGKN